MHSYLKIKSTSLSDEAKLIHKEEIRWKRRAKEARARHRKFQLRELKEQKLIDIEDKLKALFASLANIKKINEELKKKKCFECC